MKPLSPALTVLPASPSTAITGSGWLVVCKLGGAAALIAALVFRRNWSAEYMLFRLTGIIGSGPTTAPATVSGWFDLLHEMPLVGLTLLNLFDVVNYGLVGLIILGLYAALKIEQPGVSLLALVLGLTGVAIYFASNQAFAMLWLSDQYAVAPEAERASLLAAGQALLAIQNGNADYGNGFYLSYLSVNLAGLLLAILMLKSPVFGRLAGWVGIIANGLGLSYYIGLLISPLMQAILVPAAAPFHLVWYLLIGWRLLRPRAGEVVGGRESG